MLEDKDLATFLATDLSVMAQPKIGSRAKDMLMRLRSQLAGEGADLERQIQAECALGVLRAAIIAFSEVDETTLKRVALDRAHKVMEPN